MFRPRLSPAHTVALKCAAALAGLTPNQYLEIVIRPIIEEDEARRRKAMSSSLSRPDADTTTAPTEEVASGA